MGSPVMHILPDPCVPAAYDALRLVCSEGQVTAKICAPPTVPAATLQSCLAIPAPSALSAALVAELASLPDLATEGVAVENLELRYEATRSPPRISRRAACHGDRPAQVLMGQARDLRDARGDAAHSKVAWPRCL